MLRYAESAETGIHSQLVDWLLDVSPDVILTVNAGTTRSAMIAAILNHATSSRVLVTLPESDIHQSEWMGTMTLAEWQSASPRYLIQLTNASHKTGTRPASTLQ